MLKRGLVFIILISIAYADFDGWRSFPIRSEQEWIDEDVGGEGLQHNQGIARSRSNPDIIYLSHDCGQVWRSEDAGETWKKTLGIGLTTFAGNSIEVDPVDPDTIYVIMDDVWDYHNTHIKGIYKSTDGGENFEHILMDETHNSRRFEHNLAYDLTSVDGTKALRWYAVLYDPEESNDCFIYRTEDAGNSWEKLYTIDSCRPYSLYTHPTDGKTLYLATSIGLYKSEDKGETWYETGDLPGQVTSIALNEINPSIIYAVANNKLYNSNDAGASFELLKDYSSEYIFINPGYPDRLYLVGNSYPNYATIPYSHDAGKTWHDPIVTNALGLDRQSNWGSKLYGALTGMVPNRDDPDEVVFFAKSYLWKSTDGGAHMDGSSTLFTGFSCGSLNDGIAFDNNNPDRFMLFLADTGTAITTTGGDWFEERDEPISTWYSQGLIGWQGSYTGDFQPIPGSDKIIGVSGDYHTGRKTMYTDDEGELWQLVGTKQHRFYVVKYHQQDPNIAYAGPDKSTDGGRTFTAIDFGTFSGMNPTIAGVCRSDSDIIYALDAEVSSAEYVYRSDDAGESWHLYVHPGWRFTPHDGKATFAIDPINCDNIYTVDASRDLARYNGSDWISFGILDMIDNADQWIMVRGVQVDPIHPEVIYAGIGGDGIPNIFRTIDFGRTWEDISYNYPRLTVGTFSISPHTGEVFVSGCTGTRVLPPPYESSNLLYDSLYPMPSCFDGLMNGDETSVDAGGSCSQQNNCEVAGDCPDILCKEKTCTGNQCTYSDAPDDTLCSNECRLCSGGICIKDDDSLCPGNQECSLGYCISDCLTNAQLLESISLWLAGTKDLSDVMGDIEKWKDC